MAEETNKQEPLNENFLKAILIEPEVPEDKDASLTSKLGIMVGLGIPEMVMGDDYSVIYKVKYDDLKNKIMNEEHAYKIRTLGWKLDRENKFICLTI